MHHRSWSDEQVLAHFGWQNALLLGQGGEARVFGVDGNRVLRLVRPGGDIEAQHRRAELLQTVAAGNLRASFQTPDVLDICKIGGRIAVVEARLPGISLADAFAIAKGEPRRRLVWGYLDAAAAVGDIKLEGQFWGDLVASRGVRCSSYRTFLEAKLHSVRSVAGDLSSLVIEDTDSLPNCGAPSLVHFDIFPGNVLVEGDEVTAIIDFGASSMIADRRLDCWSAVAYLDPELSPLAIDDDRTLAMQWLEDRGLISNYAAAKRWIASCWCFAHDDPAVRLWCTRVLSK